MASRQQDAAYERHWRYKELRDGGMRPGDAATEVGLTRGSSSRVAYERWYIEQGGTPYISANDRPLCWVTTRSERKGYRG